MPNLIPGILPDKFTSRAPLRDAIHRKSTTFDCDGKEERIPLNFPASRSRQD
jgi:hypothetical protein